MIGYFKGCRGSPNTIIINGQNIKLLPKLLSLYTKISTSPNPHYWSFFVQNQVINTETHNRSICRKHESVECSPLKTIATSFPYPQGLEVMQEGDSGKTVGKEVLGIYSNRIFASHNSCIGDINSQNSVCCFVQDRHNIKPAKVSTKLGRRRSHEMWPLVKEL